MKLTRDQRASLFAGVPVKLTFPGGEPCPVKVGHVEVLSAHVKLEITDVRRNRKGEHSLEYTLHNDNLGQRFLSRRGDEHGYVHTGTSDVDRDAGEAVDEFTQRKITAQAKVREREAIGELLVTLEDLRSAVRERLEGNPEAVRIMGRDAWALRSKIDSVERRLKRRHAA